MNDYPCLVKRPVAVDIIHIYKVIFGIAFFRECLKLAKAEEVRANLAGWPNHIKSTPTDLQ